MNMTAKDLLDFESRINTRLEAHERSVAAVALGGGHRVGSGSDEQVALRSFNCRSLPELLQVNTCAPQFRHVSEALKYSVIQLKKTIDVARFVRQIFGHEARDPELGDDKGVSLPPVRGILETSFAKNMNLSGMIRSFSSAGTGDGENWIPTIISASYVEEYELERKVAALFKEMPMPSSPWELPVQTDVTRSRLIGEGAAMTDVSFGTDKILFSAKKLGEYFLLPEELNEDTAPAILELARAEIVASQVRAIEDAILNADLSGTHMDSDTVSASSNRKAWNGLRKQALAASSTVNFTGGGFTDQKQRDMRKLMGKYGVNPKQLVYIFGSSVYTQAQALDKLVTMEKYGPQATTFTGAIAMLDGTPVVVSEFVREDLNAAGVFDGVTTTRTIAHLVNASRWYIGRRRPIRVRVQADGRAEFDRWQLASYQRLDFQGHKQAGVAYASGALSTERSSVLGINILA